MSRMQCNLNKIINRGLYPQRASEERKHVGRENKPGKVMIGMRTGIKKIIKYDSVVNQRYLSPTV